MKGLSPLISMVLVIAFGFAAMAIVLVVINPMLDRAKDAGIVNEATQNMQLIDSAVKAVASEAQGSKRTIHLKITEGVLRTDPGNDWVYLDYTPRTRTILDGFSGDVKIETSPTFLEYFNRYAEGNISNFQLSADVIPSTDPKGQIYLVPGEPRDLVLFLPFDGNINTSIATAYDYSGYRNNGTLKNATVAACFTNNACPSWVTGNFGNATNYDGVGDYTDVGTPSTLNITNTITMMAWVKGTDMNAEGRVISKLGDYLLRLNPVGESPRFSCFITNSSNVGEPRTSTSFENDTWIHFACTYNGTTLTLYKNGVSVSSSSRSGSMMTNATNIVIGSTDGTGSFFNGTIDEVMIWNRSLTATEIAFLYETSIKKITTSGEIPNIANAANETIVLSSPGTNYFDNVKLKSGPVKIRFVIPYQRIDITNSTRFGPGDHNIVIKNDGVNTTSNKPLVDLSE
ncbi:MAG: LamG domain-containing protein [Candidatus Aenigmarchaeota archaeon]|nr:LamG domain-containing protein [Candidatus Aenigmarchaeota archaeon]